MKHKRRVLFILFTNVYQIYGLFIGFSGFSLDGGSNANTKAFGSTEKQPIANNNNSLQYHLYTPEHTEKTCYFQPDESNNCSFNSSYATKVLIHGYSVRLLPGNFFEQIKDTLLQYNNYNVIIVNWTQYDELYISSVSSEYPIAKNIGIMLNFLVSNRGVNPLDLHVIGHSLGAQIAGVAGRQVHDLGRVTGLDPAGPLFSEMIEYNRLSYNDADFVDVIHTSNYMNGDGYGLHDAIGSVDIYPNGGNTQPSCKIGGTYYDADGVKRNISSKYDLASCYHNIVLPYFVSSIHKCNYLSVECTDYIQFSQGLCNSDKNAMDRMGLYCTPIPGLPVKSKFYLNTSSTSPFC